MKKLSKIKLNQLNKAELSERELNRLLGGSNCCICRGQANLDANVWWRRNWSWKLQVVFSTSHSILRNKYYLKTHYAIQVSYLFET